MSVRPVQVSCSIGWTVATERDTDADTVLSRADATMYHEKQTNARDLVGRFYELSSVG